MHDTREKAMPAVSEKGRYPYDVGIWLRLARVPLEYLLDRLLDCLAEPGALGAGALAWKSGRKSFPALDHAPASSGILGAGTPTSALRARRDRWRYLRSDARAPGSILWPQDATNSSRHIDAGWGSLMSFSLWLPRLWICLPPQWRHGEPAERMDAALCRQGREQLIARLLTLPTDFRADAAVFHALTPMLFALGTAQATGQRAGLHYHARQRAVKCHLPG